VKSTSKNSIKFVYTEELLNSFINSQSPDIFLMNNEQIGKFKKLVAPLDLSQKNYNINNFRKEYPTIIEEEAILDGKLYMLPFSIDSLALYYNRGIFDSLSIPTPPST
jgi:multiple sugar transport system substrate-binding protein